MDQKQQEDLARRNHMYQQTTRILAHKLRGKILVFVRSQANGQALYIFLNGIGMEFEFEITIIGRTFKNYMKYTYKFLDLDFEQPK